MSLSREQMLAEMGIRPHWQLRESASSVAAEAEPSVVLPVSELVAPMAPMHSISSEICRDDVMHMDWSELEQAIQNCRSCDLCKQRKRVVPGAGDRTAKWFFVGEGPGAEEEEQGVPFVGQAGRLLDNMLATLGLQRDQGVYIANAVKCQPPGNRRPLAAEMAACRPFLLRQIALVKPQLIVLLGRAAVHSVLAEEHPLSELRGKRYELAGTPVVVTYHPAYLLRNLPEKAKAWEDLLFARRMLNT